MAAVQCPPPEPSPMWPQTLPGARGGWAEPWDLGAAGWLPAAQPLSLIAASSQVVKQVLARTSSGAFCGNDGYMHVTLHSLPFGGVGRCWQSPAFLLYLTDGTSAPLSCSPTVWTEPSRPASALTYVFGGVSRSESDPSTLSENLPGPSESSQAQLTASGGWPFLTWLWGPALASSPGFPACCPATEVCPGPNMPQVKHGQGSPSSAQVWVPLPHAAPSSCGQLHIPQAFLTPGSPP